MAFVDYMAIGDELVARSKHSSRAAGEGHDQNCGARWEWSPKHASDETRRRGVGLQHERIGSCFRHGVGVEMLSRDMRSELEFAIQQMRSCSHLCSFIYAAQVEVLWAATSFSLKDTTGNQACA
jgi:hypothetical protein